MVEAEGGAVSSLYPHCIPTVSSLYPHCIPTVSSLYPHCILTVSLQRDVSAESYRGGMWCVVVAAVVKGGDNLWTPKRFHIYRENRDEPLLASLTWRSSS